MSDENSADAVVADTTPAEAQEQVTPAQQPKRLLSVHGKEFDVSTDIGLAQAQAWYEATSSRIGEQGRELGSLRHFVKEHQASPDELKLKELAKQKAQEGDIESAVEVMLDYAKAQRKEADAKLAKEQQNSEAWDAYLEERPELVKQFGKKRIKSVSENTLDIWGENVDPFKVLDNFWMPMVNQKPASAKAEDLKKPPVTLSGGATKSQAPKAASTEPATEANPFAAVLDAHSYYRKK